MESRHSSSRRRGRRRRGGRECSRAWVAGLVLALMARAVHGALTQDFFDSLLATGFSETAILEANRKFTSLFDFEARLTALATRGVAASAFGVTATGVSVVAWAQGFNGQEANIVTATIGRTNVSGLVVALGSTELHNISGGSWVAPGGASQQLLLAQATSGDDPSIVTSSDAGATWTAAAPASGAVVPGSMEGDIFVQVFVEEVGQVSTTPHSAPLSRTPRANVCWGAALVEVACVSASSEGVLGAVFETMENLFLDGFGANAFHFNGRVISAEGAAPYARDSTRVVLQSRFILDARVTDSSSVVAVLSDNQVSSSLDFSTLTTNGVTAGASGLVVGCDDGVTASNCLAAWLSTDAGGIVYRRTTVLEDGTVAYIADDSLALLQGFAPSRVHSLTAEQLANAKLAVVGDSHIVVTMPRSPTYDEVVVFSPYGRADTDSLLSPLEPNFVEAAPDLLAFAFFAGAGFMVLVLGVALERKFHVGAALLGLRKMLTDGNKYHFYISYHQTGAREAALLSEWLANRGWKVAYDALLDPEDDLAPAADVLAPIAGDHLVPTAGTEVAPTGGDHAVPIASTAPNNTASPRDGRVGARVGAGAEVGVGNGNDILDAIATAIAGVNISATFLLILSDDINHSARVLDELQAALRLNKPIILVHARGFNFDSIRDWREIEASVVSHLFLGIESIEFHLRFFHVSQGVRNITIEQIEARYYARANFTKARIEDNMAMSAQSFAHNTTNDPASFSQM